MTSKKRIVIAGMGFGGIRAARVLAGQGHDILLVDRNNYHLPAAACSCISST